MPAYYSKLRFWRDTRVASLASGQSTTLDQGVGDLGYEWDVDADNGFRPAGEFDLSSTTDTAAQPFVDYGSITTPEANATVTHHLTLYRAPSGALVFGAGTVQWAWGLDNAGDTTRNTDPAMQQATVNLLADMGNVQPATLMSGLVAATESTDTTPPTSTITSPSSGATFSDGSAATISGTATDAGGGVVAGVEVSTDGGKTWHPVTTMSAPDTAVTWSYSWIAHGNPTTTIESRAVDDSGNLEKPGPGVTVNVNCPCSIWGANVTPTTTDSGDPGLDRGGRQVQVRRLRLYHRDPLLQSRRQHRDPYRQPVDCERPAAGQRHLHRRNGVRLAAGELLQPVAINPNTTYVASYFAPNGHYSDDGAYFYTVPQIGQPESTVNSPPLHALQNTNGVTNGVYTYSGSSTFPTSSNNASNYWVDPVFSPEVFNNAPGPVGNVSATAGYASANLTWAAPTSGDPVATYTITPYIGSAAQTPTTVTGNPAPTTGVVSGLANGTTYTFTVTASNPAGAGPASAQSNAVTPSASIAHVLNGGFENDLTGWTAGGVAPPTASTVEAHSGNASALLGTVAPEPEPLGDSTLTQTVTIPSSGNTTLSFWYWPATTDALCSGSGCTDDWQEAQIQSTSGQTLASVFKSNSNSQTWTPVTFDMTPYAGQTVVLYFNVHQDGDGDPTWMYLDDVSLYQPSVPSAPTEVSATAGNGSATVSWTAPSNTGGSAITSYTVTPYIGSAAQTPVTVTGNPPATSTAVTGLTNGTSYTFAVSATNGNGAGPPHRHPTP